ncbi:hypothetical protein CXG81DRAFT_8806 [Caulochytrium protostelioides]|uniref:Malonyl-CoA decarboxylase C-terminal domain-containing protein n=1 Tax=Caulochytrium protostelioides TaxID=1555241 RepID=A0A4V1IVG2_9FUNG|nr:hypothetical protein CXG81DRAFT_8806 [Caulochytrium protostelioides]|eukprot:RKP03949.1 hypothetical protein CXG81DRAFT_8806 [Caulochytrium protostelioides]
MLAYLRALQQSPASAEARRRLQAIEAMSEMLRRQIRIWFSMGSVVVKQITWASPACILESIIQHEAIHEIPTWDHLKQRLGPGRLCFAVFHQSMPYEVLTFVEVALQTGVTTNAQLILDDPSPSGVNHATGVSHDTAMFYSITSTQPGLKGIDLGNYLIKWAVKEMTLLRHADWIADPAIAQRVRPLLMRLAARYLLEAKRPGHPATVYDPVANFHIRNGAMVRQLLWRGDTSQRALSQSFGIMVNYQYTLDAVEANTVAYVRRGAVAVHPRQQDPDLAATVLD